MISDQTSPVQVNQFGRFNCHFRVLGKGIRKISFNSLMKKKDWCLFNKMAKKHKKNLGRRAQNIEDHRGNVDVHKHVACREVKKFFTSLH
jgi:hypothetical protein